MSWVSSSSSLRGALAERTCGAGATPCAQGWGARGRAGKAAARPSLGLAGGGASRAGPAKLLDRGRVVGVVDDIGQDENQLALERQIDHLQHLRDLAEHLLAVHHDLEPSELREDEPRQRHLSVGGGGVLHLVLVVGQHLEQHLRNVRLQLLTVQEQPHQAVLDALALGARAACGLEREAELLRVGAPALVQRCKQLRLRARLPRHPLDGCAEL